MFFLLCIDSYQQCRLFHGLWSRCTRRLWLFVQSSTGLCHLLRFGFQIVQIDQRWMFCTSTVRHASPSWRHARKSIQQRLHRLNNIILNFLKKKSNHRFQSFPCWSIRSLFSFFSSSLLFELLKVKVNDPKDLNNFDYNGDFRFSLDTNFYCPCVASKYAYNIADLLYGKVLPAINSQAGPGKLFKESISRGDTNAYLAYFKENESLVST